MNPRDLLFATTLLLGVIGMARTGVAMAEERIYLSRPEIEVNLIGKGVLSKNLASGTLSHWEFRRDGSVEASRSGLGKATGTWAIQEDGRMCVTMLNRTSCRYWFRHADSFANSDSRLPDAPVVAEVVFE